MKSKVINIIGGGLAGSQAAVFLAEKGYTVNLFEMRPNVKTEVHNTAMLGELVCSNSLKSEGMKNASGVLKEELKLLNCKLLEIAYENSVPAGMALAVDRENFSRKITEIVKESGVNLIRREVVSYQEFDLNEEILLVATGPMTSDKFMESIGEITGSDKLYFFDAVSPIIDSEEIDFDKCFYADRHSPEEENGDYINCPMNEGQYKELVRMLVEANVIENADFEKKYLFERCQPIEEIARSGIDAMRFGPLKPVGLTDPNTGEEPYAVVQLRQENNDRSMYNLVGFQTRLKWGEQKKIVHSIPGLENVEILRYGVMHKNTYIDSPRVLDKQFCLEKNPAVYFAGQITGVEGYVECIASGLYAAINIDRKIQGLNPVEFPEATILGGLFKYVNEAEKLKPMYANFGLLPPVKAKRKDRRIKKAQRAVESMKEYLKNNEI